MDDIFVRTMDSPMPPNLAVTSMRDTGLSSCPSRPRTGGANHIAELQDRKTEYLLLVQDIDASIASQAQSIKEELESDEEVVVE